MHIIIGSSIDEFTTINNDVIVEFVPAMGNSTPMPYAIGKNIPIHFLKTLCT